MSNLDNRYVLEVTRAGVVLLRDAGRMPANMDKAMPCHSVATKKMGELIRVSVCKLSKDGAHYYLNSFEGTVDAIFNLGDLFSNIETDLEKAKFNKRRVVKIKTDRAWILKVRGEAGGFIDISERHDGHNASDPMDADPHVVIPPEAVDELIAALVEFTLKAKKRGVS